MVGRGGQERERERRDDDTPIFGNVSFMKKGYRCLEIQIF